MKKNIILAGVGGQGILSISAIIDWAALKMGLNIKQAEVHGMSQRGGAVQSHLRISDHEIFSDLIPLKGADLILAVEPMEALRYLPFLSDTGRIVSSIDPFINIPNYPQTDEVINQIKKTNKPILVDATGICCEIGNSKAVNIVMLGAGAAFIGIAPSILEEGIIEMFGRKGETVIESNLKAFRIGMELSKKQQ